MTDKLKPCWCSGKDTVISVRRVAADIRGYRFVCNTCGLMAGERSSAEEALKAWNTRPLEGSLIRLLQEVADEEWSDGGRISGIDFDKIKKAIEEHFNGGTG